MKVAIVGTGIAGNVAAYKLHREHEITVYEAAPYVGGHTNTIDVVEDGRTIPVDTGFIVFNDRTYPNFIELLEEVGQDFDVTRERIRQIEAKALRKLRHPSRSRVLKSFLEN